MARKLKERVLTAVEEFYVRGNLERMDDGRIAAALGVPEGVIRPYREAASRDTMFQVNMMREKGVTAMTGGASGMVDDLVRKQAPTITEADVQKAVEERDFKRAEDLDRAMKKQDMTIEEARRAKFSDRYHYFKPVKS